MLGIGVSMFVRSPCAILQLRTGLGSSTAHHVRVGIRWDKPVRKLLKSVVHDVGCAVFFFAVLLAHMKEETRIG